MKTNSWRGLLVIALTAWLGAPACGQMSKGDGSESHFVECHTDADCLDGGARARCASGRCVTSTTTLPDGGDVVPAACRVDTTETGPFAVQFRFENSSDAKVSIALGGSCGPTYQVTSCADGYARPLQLFAYCGALCPEVPSCVSGACYDQPVPVTSGKPVADPWDGYDLTAHTVPAGQCVERVVAAAGHYRIKVPVYPAVLPTAPTGGALWTPLYTATVDFTLPSPGGVVDVPIDRAPTDAGVPCYPVVARKYGSARDCYTPKATIAGLCLRESRPNDTAGTGEIACLAAPDGSHYAIVKGYTQCLEVDGLPAPAGTGGGWAVKGDSGLCESATEIVATDGGVSTDTACRDAISRGRWIQGPFIPELDFRGSVSASDGGALASDGGADAVECP